MRYALLFLALSSAIAQPPKIANGRFETRAVTGLDAEMRKLTGATAGPEWVGYAVPMIAGEHRSCCWNSDQCCGRCNLESSSGFNRTSGTPPDGVVK
jgi:hypothetical protein